MHYAPQRSDPVEDYKHARKAKMRQNDDMEKRGLMYNPGGHPISRDWEHIECKREACVCNVSGKCAMPSRCRIGEDGKYDGFLLCEGPSPSTGQKVEKP